MFYFFLNKKKHWKQEQRTQFLDEERERDHL